MYFVNYKEKQLKHSPKQELEKIKRWCAYQERSHFETRMKLRKAGLNETQISDILSELISENYLNEERFARAFAGGKFRIKHWGLSKIKTELKKHGVSEPNIQLALQSIDEEKYNITLRELLNKKIGQNTTKSHFQIKALVYRYLLSKGYEPDRVMEEINRNFKEHES